VTGAGALKLVGCSGEVPVKSTIAERLVLSIVIGDFDGGALIGFDTGVAAFEGGEQIADGRFAVVEDVGHVAGDGVSAEFAREIGEFCCAARVGGELGFEVGDVFIRVAGGVFRVGEKGVNFALDELALGDETRGFDVDAFFVDGFGARAHGAGGEAADVGVVAAAGDEKGGGAFRCR
jgi:hypothetical protein